MWLSGTVLAYSIMCEALGLICSIAKQTKKSFILHSYRKIGNYNNDLIYMGNNFHFFNVFEVVNLTTSPTLFNYNLRLSKRTT